ncbi:LLM class flavin-dependent oxidoreductase [Polynucleobacter sp. MG-5-Ahmo-C2]|uniref:LLM class flavin-dependent oxidoreductase n=1 Tax=Polynucleobacter sp. MG-5-Ahmo-C2 TaxID=2081051 RepID=UPI001BFE5A2D|nr:LLM class flavin-dependent oxidoreductase [Polynucleobacter sp. MG-5-Ahmo-C2]QWD97944.1 LLM class flavin-dependent oxidoreductase [Polynucleobacter sp. MG-5-Ahmo-C2]
MANSIPYSILDISPIPQGFTAEDALRNSLDVAQHAEKWGYTRYWVAEHHNMTGNASSATAVLIGYLAAGTASIKVGSGGVMLPNHAPLVIAEQFGTLESLYPGRIELGLGRAPGTDQMTARALRRDLMGSDDRFPQDIRELQHYFGPIQEGQSVRAIPGADTNVPIWILGSSLYGAQLAAHFGLPYAFASHFAPEQLLEAMKIYRELFKPSAQLADPYSAFVMNVVAAGTDEEAQHLFTSLQQHFIRMRRNTRGQLPPPIDNLDTFCEPHEKAAVTQMLQCSVVGSLETVKKELRHWLDATGANEILFTGQIFDHQARLRSFEIAAEAAQSL